MWKELGREWGVETGVLIPARGNVSSSTTLSQIVILYLFLIMYSFKFARSPSLLLHVTVERELQSLDLNFWGWAFLLSLPF